MLRIVNCISQPPSVYVYVYGTGTTLGGPLGATSLNVADRECESAWTRRRSSGVTEGAFLLCQCRMPSDFPRCYADVKMFRLWACALDVPRLRACDLVQLSVSRSRCVLPSLKSLCARSVELRRRP